MRVALDTNVLVRYLVWDDAAQAARAAAVIEGAVEIYVPGIVLCETVWVLRRAYRLTESDILRALRVFMAAGNVVLDRVAAEAGLRMLERAGDYADGVALHDARRAGAEEMVTFDRRFADLGEKVRLL
jgi:predicted nucleic-acid-binding protein